MGDQKGSIVIRNMNTEITFARMSVNMSFKDGKIHTEERCMIIGEEKITLKLQRLP